MSLCSRKGDRFGNAFMWQHAERNLCSVKKAHYGGVMLSTDTCGDDVTVFVRLPIAPIKVRVALLDQLLDVLERVLVGNRHLDRARNVTRETECCEVGE